MIDSWNFESDNYAVTLSGGGAKGAYQVGVLKYLSEINFFKTGPSYIAGISVGALNASTLAQHNKSEFSLSIENLEKFWLEDVTKNSDVLQYKFPRYLAALWNSSVGTATKLEKILKKRVNIDKIRTSDINLEVSAVNMNSGEIKDFDNHHPFLLKGIIASAAFPFVFPPVKIENAFYIDGGVRDLVPLKRVVKQGVDNVICISTDHISETVEINNVFDVGKNLIRICAADNFRNDVNKFVRINNQVEAGEASANRRQIGIMLFNPSQPLGDTFDFSTEMNQWRIDLGYEDARRLIENQETGKKV